jgi:hypothetical protein
MLAKDWINMYAQFKDRIFEKQIFSNWSILFKECKRKQSLKVI